MERKVYLIGEIEKKFGSEFSIFADSYRDIIRNIDCNRPGFKEYLLKSDEEGVGFTINFAGEDIEEKDLLTPLKQGDVTITAVPAGSKSDAVKVVTGVILMAISFAMGDPTGGSLAAWTQSGLQAVGFSLAMQGIQGMLAPDPSTDVDADEGYLYAGSEAIIVEGDPIPLLYGQLRVPGQPVSVAFNTVDASATFSSGYVSSNTVTIGNITVTINVAPPIQTT